MFKTTNELVVILDRTIDVEFIKKKLKIGVLYFLHQVECGGAKQLVQITEQACIDRALLIPLFHLIVYP